MANIVNSLSGIVEIIHSRENGAMIKTHEIAVRYDKNEVTYHREDFIAYYLYCMRNLCSHANNIERIDYDFFEFFIKILMAYLIENYQQIEREDFDIKNHHEFFDVVYEPKRIINSFKKTVTRESTNSTFKYSYANYLL